MYKGASVWPTFLGKYFSGLTLCGQLYNNCAFKLEILFT